MNRIGQRRERVLRRPWIALLLLGTLLIVAAAPLFVFRPSAGPVAPSTATSGTVIRGIDAGPTSVSSIGSNNQFASYGPSSRGLSTGELMALMGLLALAGIVLVGLAILPRGRNADG